MFSDHYLIDERDKLLYRIEYPAGGLVKEYCIRLLFIPEEMIPEVVNSEHHGSNHLGKDRLMAKLRQKFWFPNMGSRIDQVLNQCSICMRMKALRNPFRAPLKTRKIVTGPGQVWYLDHLGPIILTRGKHRILSAQSFRNPPEDINLVQKTIKQKMEKYILVMVDSYSQYVELGITRSTTAEETANTIHKHLVCNHSWPRAIVHDKGTAFVNKIIEELARLMQIKNYQTAAMNPRSNGLAEAKVKAVSIILCKLVHERGGKWQKWVPYVKYHLNATPTRANGISPFMIQYNRFPNDPISLALLSEFPEENLLQTQTEYCTNMLSKLKHIQNIVNTVRTTYNQDMEKVYNAKVKLPGREILGDFCYLYSPYFSTHTKGIRRLNIPWRGPFVVTDMAQDRRLVRLARVADFVESERWIPIHRIKMTKFGLNPPAFTHISGLSKEIEKEYNELSHQDTLEELIVSDEFRQPCDDNDIKEDIMVLPDRTEMTTSQPPVLKYSEQKDKKSLDTTNFLCKIPPRIKTTRQGPSETVPCFQTVKQFYDFKIKDGMDLVQISLQDKPRHRIWTNISNITPQDSSLGAKDVLKDVISKFKNKYLAKKGDKHLK